MAHQWLTRAVVRDVCAAEGLDERIRVLATSQGGAVRLDQACLVGASRDDLRRRRDAGMWLPLHRGVYAVGHDALTTRGRAIGALLACPKAILLADRTAGAIWSMVDDDLAVPHVIVPADTRTRLNTVRARRSRDLQPGDRRTHLGLPLTSPERTLLDMAESCGRAETAAALREARVKGLVTPESIERRLAAARGRRGVPTLRALLQSPSAAPTRSRLERRLLRLLKEAGLPKPATDEWVAGHLCDLVWPAQRLIVETDAFNTHGDERTFESDRARDAALQREGWRVLRFTALQLEHEPLRTVATIATVLGRHG